MHCREGPCFIAYVKPYRKEQIGLCTTLKIQSWTPVGMNTRVNGGSQNLRLCKGYQNQGLVVFEVLNHHIRAGSKKIFSLTEYGKFRKANLDQCRILKYAWTLIFYIASLRHSFGKNTPNSKLLVLPFMAGR